MALHNVWIATASDGLVRGDQVIGIGSHETPRIPGKTQHWLLTLNLAVTAGSGDREGWDVGIVDRTLCQTSWQPRQAPAELAALLARLDEAGAAGIVTAQVPRRSSDGNHNDGQVHFGFTPFSGVNMPLTTPAPAAAEVSGLPPVPGP